MSDDDSPAQPGQASQPRREQYIGIPAEYEAELRRLAKTCDFTASTDAASTPLLQSLRDQFVFGLNNEAWQRRLLQETEVLTFTRTVEKTKAAEAAQKDAHQFNTFSARGSSEIHALKPGRKKAKAQRNEFSQNQVKHISEETLDFETLSVDSKETNHVAESLKPCPKVEALINGHPVTLEVDTGSVVTLVNEVTWRNLLDAPTLTPSSLELKSYSHGRVPKLGKFGASFEINGQRKEFCARVVKGNARNLLGRDLLCQVCLDWQSIFAVSVPREDKLEIMLKEFDEIFVEELGLCKGIKARINMKSDATPTFRKARPLPYAMKKKVENELDGLEKKGIITQVQYSDWAAPVVPVLKRDGSVRLCGDFSVSINPKMEVNQYPLPQPNEMFTNLNGGVLFTKLDFSEAYLQIELDKESQKLVVINTHKGLFQYSRLPFGISSSPAIFQQVMDKLFQGLNGVQCYLDDIIITGKTEGEHMQNLLAVLQRIKEYGLGLRKDKCSFLQTSVEYLGNIISREGIHPSPKKIEAIKKIPEPKNVTELRSFLGMPTAKHGIADGLSRLPCGFDPQFESGHALVDLVEYEVFGTLPVSAEDVKDASRRDALLSSVIDDVCKGRKVSKNLNFKEVEVTAFSRREAELTVCDGVLIWRSRVVVPKELRGRLLKELHAVHPGIVRMKSLAREHFWWPCMDSEIENVARSCCECQEGKSSKVQEKQKAYHDRTAKMREFEVGDHVWAQNYKRRGPKYVRAKVLRKTSPLSYRVFVRDGLI
eukprot:gene16067-7417_t